MYNILNRRRKSMLSSALLDISQELSRAVPRTVMTVKDVGGIIVSIITALGVIGAATLPAVLKRRQEIADRKEAEEQARRDVHAAGLEAVMTLYEHLNECLRQGATRVILFVGKDSGGVPSPGSPYYANAIHAVTRHDQESFTNSYHNIQVDEAYVRMILDLLKSPLATVTNTTEAMPDSMLKRFYSAEGVVQSVVVGLGVRRNQFYYLSVASHAEEFTPEQVTKFTLIANDIWQLIGASL